jgi:hypothetical protein
MYEMKREGRDSKILPDGNEYHEEDEIWLGEIDEKF